MQKILLAIITLVLFLPNLFNTDLQTSLLYNGKEKFDPALSELTSIARLEAYTDSLAATKQIGAGSYAYAALLGGIVENRFYHGFSHFSLSENWIAAVAGKFLKEDYSCKVQPAEILEHTNAACSQQALVMMQVLRDKKIPYRSVGFPHHYALEIYADKEWYFFDTNMEPVITKDQRCLAHWNHRNDIVKKYYDPAKHNDINYQFGNGEMATVGVANEIPAQKAAFFHMVTGIFSKIGWLLPLLILVYKGGFNIEIPFVSLMLKKKRSLISLPA